MTTTTETTTEKPKQPPAFYIFENGADGKVGKRVGAAFLHKKGKGLNIVIDNKRLAAFPPKAKTAEQPAATEGSGA